MVIPNIIYKTGKDDKIIDEEILKCFENNKKRLNGTLIYFSNKTCRQFIKKYFPVRVLHSFDSLIPGAFKADLWRLCVLYIHGGIYSDLTQTFLQNYDVNVPKSDLILTLDHPQSIQNLLHMGIQIPPFAIYNAFMCTKPKNTFILFCIKGIVNQISQQNYGVNPLDITGPIALAKHFVSFFRTNLKTGCHKYLGLDKKIHIINVPFVSDTRYCINIKNERVFKNRIESHYYKIYNTNNASFGLYPKEHYSNLWRESKIFANNTPHMKKKMHRLLL